MVEMDYEKWLERAYSKLSKTTPKKGRFEIPEVQHFIIGNRTFIKNFRQICNVINREEQHLLRFLVKELATAGTIEGDQAVFHGKFNEALIKHLVEDYIKEYVICPVCQSPDTKIVREERFRFLVCEACGAKSSIRAG
ncbi:translation initiation factor IF-2 subunit beta [Candidatus Bathyarchaeota archaeon]|nr:MAG: translation initiation factor IF-2 subunit beta [Candidatus Bathyarchaeota archaeon]